MDQTKRPLRIPTEFALYAEKHGIFDMYKRLIEQLIIAKPEEPIGYLIHLLKKENDDVPQICILGPPCSGKHSIAKLISSKMRCALLTPKTLLEETDNEIKRKILKVFNKERSENTTLWEQLPKIPPDLLVRILRARFDLADCVKKGWILEGFPQTRGQALAMQENGLFPKHCIVLEAPDTVLVERAAGKRIDKKTGDVYHTTFDWPGNPEVQYRLKEPKGYKEVDMFNKLVVYHRHIDGILRCYEQVVKKVNADQPKADVFSQAFSFLCCQPRSSAPHTPRIILIGCKGSGKGVQAALLANKYNLVNVHCGQLIKQSIAQETPSGLAAKPYVEKNLIIPDNIVLDILKDRLCGLDCVTRGWVLHEYPRSREQAEQLDKAGLRPNRVFFLDIPNDSVIERLTLRAMDPVTGEKYHLLYNPPISQEVKDRLWKNEKDSVENVQKNLSQFVAFSEELLDYYTEGQHVNSDQDPHTVFECLESMICKPLPKNFN
ncbi:adenylate kinase 8-like [Biomphalaria glabrata]|uniref:Adenylate kinase 8-like n=1 Tax=Biomphalaria glabrata TaxID=6526 RepID=A0A9U8E3M8_BIOGL|nr:adenylate kinase 8-like [Biomphalaria glabrata]KAI8779473.1 adenylate kinase 8 [Biomphalaria glabrata]